MKLPTGEAESMAASRERLIGNLLGDSIVLEEILLSKLPAMLRLNGATPEFENAVRAFLAPAVEIVQKLERDVIDHLKHCKTMEAAGQQEATPKRHANDRGRER